MNPESQRKLESWKEIAAYLQRDTTTAQRWEKEEGLPIHRHSHKSRSSVYAHPAEIDAWKLSRKAAPAEPAPRPSFWRIPTFALAILLCLVMVGNGIRPQAVAAAGGKGLAKRLVCRDCGVGEGGFSRDGRTLVFPDSKTGDLAIRDMESGKVTRLFVKSGTWDDGSKDADYSGATPTLSPDRRQIVYSWQDMAEHDKPQLRATANEPHAKARILVEAPEHTELEPIAWFPDGKSVLVLVSKPDHEEIQRVAVADGGVKVLKVLQWPSFNAEISQGSLSSDGKYVVYATPAVSASAAQKPAPRDPKDFHIYVMASDGSGETELVKAAGNNLNPVWTPDGKHVLFTSDRSGKVDLWSIAVQDGKASGPETQVSPEIGDGFMIGFFGGSYYYNHFQGDEVIHLVDAGGTRSKESFLGTAPSWSPDGKSIAFKRHRANNPTRYDLVIRSLETGGERAYQTTLGTTGGGPPLWFHDSKSVMTGIQRADGTGGAYRIDVATGEFKEVPGVTNWIGLSPDDRTVYGVRDPKESPHRVVSFDLATGKESLVFAPPDIGTTVTALSPDGRTLALEGEEKLASGAYKLRIARVGVDGTGYREIYTGEEPTRLNAAVKWSGDGRSILFASTRKGGVWHYDLRRVPTDGSAGPSPVFTVSEQPLRLFDVSPDGAHYVYSVNEGADELWALDNILSMLK